MKTTQNSTRLETHLLSENRMIKNQLSRDCLSILELDQMSPIKDYQSSLIRSEWLNSSPKLKLAISKNKHLLNQNQSLKKEMTEISKIEHEVRQEIRKSIDKNKELKKRCLRIEQKLQTLEISLEKKDNIGTNSEGNSELNRLRSKLDSQTNKYYELCDFQFSKTKSLSKVNSSLNESKNVKRDKFFQNLFIEKSQKGDTKISKDFFCRNSNLHLNTFKISSKL